MKGEPGKQPVAVFDIFDPPGGEEKKVKFAPSVKKAKSNLSQGDASEDDDYYDEEDAFADTGDELALVAAGFSQFQRINIFFTQISTEPFSGYVRCAKRDPTPLPAYPARDYFLRNLDLDVGLKGVSDRAQVERQLTQMAYLLDI